MTEDSVIHEKQAYSNEDCAHARTADTASHLQNSSIDLRRQIQVLSEGAVSLRTSLAPLPRCSVLKCVFY